MNIEHVWAPWNVNNHTTKQTNMIKHAFKHHMIESKQLNSNISQQWWLIIHERVLIKIMDRDLCITEVTSVSNRSTVSTRPMSCTYKPPLWFSTNPYALGRYPKNIPMPMTRLPLSLSHPGVVYLTLLTSTSRRLKTLIVVDWYKGKQTTFLTGTRYDIVQSAILLGEVLQSPNSI